ncbi:MAG: BrnA antitoxin family protein [Pseudomonadota bacterium]
MTKKLTNKSGDAVGLSNEVLESMRPMKELDPDFIKKFKAAKRGRPAGRNKAVVSISIDRDLLDILRESGNGWQSRINELLRAAIGLR